MGAIISPTYLIYIISRKNKSNNRKNKMNRIQGGDIHRLLPKNDLEKKWLIIYVTEEEH